MNIRNSLEQREIKILSSFACLSTASAGRQFKEEPCPVRTAFQHDRDRILHSKSFRRLKHKTQVFLAPEGDHYRTRLTHTLEVGQIARTVARALALNEDLTEAIALGHDLGHTPFGHAGERVLDELTPGGFRHVSQSVRVVEVLEKDGRGLNLTLEVRDGILKHSKGLGPLLSEDPDVMALTLEGRIVRLADVIAYVNHDLDDALRAGLLCEQHLPQKLLRVLGGSRSERIHNMVTDIIQASLARGGGEIALSAEVGQAITDLRDWLFENVYRAQSVHEEFLKAARIIRELFLFFAENEDSLLQFGGRGRLMSVGEEMKLVFRLGSLGFSLGVKNLVEIREDFREYLDRSSADASLLQLGSVPHRGDHIPVHDLKQLFRLQGSVPQDGQALLVMAGASRPWAVVADRIDGIFPKAQFESQPLSLLFAGVRAREYDTLDLWRGEPLVFCDTGKLEKCWGCE